MAIPTYIDINFGSPTQITRELFTTVGSGTNIVGSYTNGFYGSTDFEIWDSAVGGVQLTDSVDYQLSGVDNDYSAEAGQTVYSLFQILNPTYQTGNIYITAKLTGTFMEKAILDDIVSSIGASNRSKITQQNKGFWGDVLWSSTTTIEVKPKYQNGESWIGVTLNDGTYIEDTTSSNITITLDATTLDGIGAVQNDSWYWLCGYEDSGGALAFDFMFLPSTLISASNPTNDITLTQLNSQDIRSLYPIGADIALWETSAKFETPLYDTTGATYTPTSTDMVIDSYPSANQIRLSANLTVTNFTAATAICYLVNGFQPIDCTTETIAAAISSRGWKNTGVSVLTDSSAQIIPFTIQNGEFLFSNGSGAADYAYNTGRQVINVTTGYVETFITASPQDKVPIVSVSGLDVADIFTRPYYETYGENWVFGLTSFSRAQEILKSEARVLHSIISVKYGSGTSAVCVIRGYVI